ncbi:hypothetical protein H0H93_002404 [Arthromyces matolae]|nr:hypothetical protein H0H93_002404 [Arthromyces matolae]
MFAVVARTVHRRAFIQSQRCMAKKSSPSPSSSSTGPTTPEETLPSLDFSPADPSSQQQQQQTGARSSKGTLTSAEKQRRVFGRVLLAMLAAGLAVNAVHMGRDWEEEELKAKRMTLENAPSTRWGRTKERFIDIFDYFNKPAWPELLPPPYPAPHQKPYTLLISVDDLLVTSTWDRQHGWRTAKRPGVDYFLAYISQFYEVVIFTSQNYYTAIPIIEKLDRYNFYITHRLFREATRSINGKIVKDLSYLNRDLAKVISLDTDADHVSTHPENAIVIPKWKGDPKDTGLIAMIPFLESLAIYRPPDVRPILESYQGKNIPIEYAKREAEQKAKHIAEWQSKKALRTSSFSSMFGLSSSSTSAPYGTVKTEGNVPPTYLEQKRYEAQMQYREEQKYIEEHREELEKLLAQDQAAAQGDMPGSLWEAVTQLGGKKTEEAENTQIKEEQK